MASTGTKITSANVGQRAHIITGPLVGNDAEIMFVGNRRRMGWN